MKARDMITVVNRLIARDTRVEDFVTLVLARVDLETRVCEYASAGHTTGYVFDQNGAVKHRLESMVPPLGVQLEINFDRMSTFDLEEGDLLLLLTDGILEAENSSGECLNEERILEIVRDNRHHRASEIVDILHKTVVGHCGGKLRDDITSIVFKYRAGGASGSSTR
jgi:sigma-B regulation protein RsbU (phosphoserine phosphatase)